MAWWSPERTCAGNSENRTPDPARLGGSKAESVKMKHRQRMRPMPSPLLSRRLWLAALPTPSLAACASDPAPAQAPVAAAPPPPAEPPLGGAVARVEITQWQVGFIGQVHWDEGVLIYQGRRHRFRVRGLGAGGVGMARVRPTGEVYDMTSLPQFPGIFGQARRYAARFGCRIPRACDCVCSPIARGWRRSWARMGFLSRCWSPASHKFLAPIRRRLSGEEILTHGGGV